jgi:hypothetical protein
MGPNFTCDQIFISEAVEAKVSRGINNSPHILTARNCIQPKCDLGLFDWRDAMVVEGLLVC